MTIPPTVLLLVAIAMLGASIALAGFVWAVRHGQLDPDSGGGAVIFDDDELPGPASPPLSPRRNV